MNLAAPRFSPPTKATPQSVPEPAVIEDDGEQSVDVEADVNAQDEYEYSGKSATQIEDDVKDLFKGTAVNHEVDIKEGGDVVAGFPDDFRLLRHQIQAREWMKQRETKESHGGILADDMGSVLLVIVLTWKTESVTDLVKLFRPLFALSKESPTGVPKMMVTFRQRCGSHFFPWRFYI